MNDDHSQDFWFPAKKVGWGWKLPVKWQGWVVLAIYLAALGAGLFYVNNDGYASSSPYLVGGLTALLVLVCYIKGEKKG